MPSFSGRSKASCPGDSGRMTGHPEVIRAAYFEITIFHTPRLSGFVRPPVRNGEDQVLADSHDHAERAASSRFGSVHVRPLGVLSRNAQPSPTKTPPAWLKTLLPACAGRPRAGAARLGRVPTPFVGKPRDLTSGLPALSSPLCSSTSLYPLGQYDRRLEPCCTGYTPTFNACSFCSPAGRPCL